MSHHLLDHEAIRSILQTAQLLDEHGPALTWAIDDLGTIKRFRFSPETAPVIGQALVDENEKFFEAYYGERPEARYEHRLPQDTGRTVAAISEDLDDWVRESLSPDDIEEHHGMIVELQFMAAVRRRLPSLQQDLPIAEAIAASPVAPVPPNRKTENKRAKKPAAAAESAAPRDPAYLAEGIARFPLRVTREVDTSGWLRRRLGDLDFAVPPDWQARISGADRIRDQQIFEVKGRVPDGAPVDWDTWPEFSRYLRGVDFLRGKPLITRGQIADGGSFHRLEVPGVDFAVLHLGPHFTPKPEWPAGYQRAWVWLATLTGELYAVWVRYPLNPGDDPDDDDVLNGILGSLRLGPPIERTAPLDDPAALPAAGAASTPSRDWLPDAPTRVARTKGARPSGPVAWMLLESSVPPVWVWHPDDGFLRLADLERDREAGPPWNFVASEPLSRDGRRVLHEEHDAYPDFTHREISDDLVTGERHARVLPREGIYTYTSPSGVIVRVDSTSDPGDNGRRVTVIADGRSTEVTLSGWVSVGGRAVQFSPDGRTAAFSITSRPHEYPELCVIDLETAAVLERYPSAGAASTDPWSPDGTRLLVRPTRWIIDQVPDLLDRRSGRRVSLAPLFSTRTETREIHVAGWIDDGMLLAAELRERRLILLATDLATGEHHELLDLPYPAGRSYGFRELVLASDLVRADPSVLVKRTGGRPRRR
ncbi:hypothetical protein [Schumannella sp. 10F1B-5-1]|uniref:hypothetical protein n=1 Tax=Schumannella sp. 10F1B-5-1 TaxID=2590780 RepID=UPI0011320CEB|nr:hypothetical protein [Schumannella sp. 10F1B-5-1]TPW78382.1 hypothetical protein FJ658_00820 [Schumannella sp. 10F1B-5-1]